MHLRTNLPTFYMHYINHFFGFTNDYSKTMHMISTCSLLAACVVLQKAFSAVQQLWGQKLPKEYGPHMAESMLAILYHIIKGEAVIKEKLGPTAESSSSTSGSSTTAAARPADEPARAQPEINMRHLQQVQYTYWSAFLVPYCVRHRQIY